MGTKRALNNVKSLLMLSFFDIITIFDIPVYLLECRRIIVEYEQDSQERAVYGKQTLKEQSKELTKEFGKGFSVSNIQFMRHF